jgi:hypothetical protein
MFGLPKKYELWQEINTKNFLIKGMKAADKERIKSNLLRVHLDWQITGEEIPSLINEQYNCPVIMSFDCKITSTVHAAFIANIMQQQIKAPCVLRFYDGGDCVYSFAHKRLNQNDSSQVVILEQFITHEMSCFSDDDTAKEFEKILAFDNLQNKSDKLSLYLETMVKAFILSNNKLFMKICLLFDSKVWYNRDEVYSLFLKLLKLQELKLKLKAEKLHGEKAKLNSEIKSIILYIKENYS